MHISPDKLEQIEYLLSQSTQGIHLLFDNNSIAKILSNPTENIDFFTVDNIKKVQGILKDFIERKSLSEKQKFLKNLDVDTYELLVRTYFNIVDNAVLEATEHKH